jgi:F-type H+-transporting ATPase subunit epsilon
MAKMHLEVVTPERVMLSEDVDMFEARGTLGEFGVLPGHVTFLTTVEPGEVRIFNEGRTRYLATGGGFAEVVNDKITLLLNSAEFPEEIDVQRAYLAKERAEETLRELGFDNKEYLLFELALYRAIARIGVASRAGK